MVFSLLALFLVSCASYKFGYSSDNFSEKKVHVSHVDGDLDGQWTSDLIAGLVSMGLVLVDEDRSDYVVDLRLLKRSKENIGYDYARDSHNQRLDYIVASEARLGIEAEIIVRERVTNKKLSQKLFAQVDFDFDPNFLQNNAISFSLGQFHHLDAAKDTAQEPLRKALVMKVIDYLSYTM